MCDWLSKSARTSCRPKTHAPSLPFPQRFSEPQTSSGIDIYSKFKIDFTLADFLVVPRNYEQMTDSPEKGVKTL